ncbi:hypothetical protein [Bradyrhizobium sp.]|uniref:hypothetical protein n=1 Tax=Bradyrhizobium sp. TaxID=376 RepID=UPI001EC763D8|nr:hypothetical protein [Bradyrhizobium sp.]MBV9984483.1 HNH endonuclease [Bradyrhizobium sp.]
MILPYATITIGARTQYVVKVSWEDYDFLMQWPWTYAVSHKGGGLVYARRSERIDGRNATILMHRVVIARMGLKRPSKKHFVDHWNGDSLDNRRIADDGRAQLRWVTPRQNMANQRGVINVPVAPKFQVVGEIPF